MPPYRFLQTPSWAGAANRRLRLALQLAGPTVATIWYSDISASEFIISTAKELAGLAYLINNKIDFAGKTIKLAANINHQDADVTILNNDYSVKSDLTLRSWTPIGTGENLFRGTFDGQGYTICGLDFCPVIHYTFF